MIRWLQRNIHQHEVALQQCQADLIAQKELAINSANAQGAAHQACLADLLLEKEKVCRLRKFCVVSWIVIFSSFYGLSSRFRNRIVFYVLVGF